MPPDSPRVQELRRRLDADPASIAFGQLAEEYRRAGHYEDAVECCRAGLVRHPAYRSARVTLGRALMELGKLDEAASEFEHVLQSAADNLTALRSIAEIHERRGNPELAVTYYKRALALLQNGHDVGEGRRDRVPRDVAHRGDTPSVAPSSSGTFADAPSTAPRTPASQSGPAALEPNGEQLAVAQPQVAGFADLDAILGSLGVPDAAPPAAIEVLLAEPPQRDASAPDASLVPGLRTASSHAVDRVPGEQQSGLAAALRAFDEAGAPVEPGIDTNSESASEDPVLQELKAWLQALHPKRSDPTDSAV